MVYNIYVIYVYVNGNNLIGSKNILMSIFSF